MTLTLFASEVARFFASSEPEVLCVTGKWGVGKTYGWNSNLHLAQTAKKVTLHKYAYVSLFGRNSLNDVRSAIVEQTVDSRVPGKVPDLSSLETTLSSLTNLTRNAGIIGRIIPQAKKYIESSQRLLFVLTREQIVCLDDLERAGSGLGTKDIIGMVSQLREEKRCKVVILLNEEMLSEGNKSDFQAQLEKVADTVLKFEPSPTEAAEFGLKQGMPYYEYLKENCTKLKILNIRVIKRAEKFAERLNTILHGLDARVLKQAVHTATIACLSKFQPENTPSLDEIRQFNSYETLAARMGSTDSKISPSFMLLRDYEYNNTDEFDEAVISGVENGFFDEHLVQSKGQLVNQNLAASDKTTCHKSAWDIYYNSFEDDGIEIVASLEQSLLNNISVIDPPNINSIVRLLKSIGENAKAGELLTYYVSNKSGGKEFWDLTNFHLGFGGWDADLVSAFKTKFDSFPITVDPYSLLEKFAEREAWNTADEEVLAKLTPDDFYTIFKTLRGTQLRTAISGALFFRRVSNPTPHMQTINANVQSALDRIAQENPVNARRVQMYLS
ncbi:hypothetical protein HCU64_21600 [Methylobacterium sp. C25]|uniref:hypothetical protein n=1 Tax=Methylobacterium sp. C25 TaxID=2721622 RepID=UPI001F1EC9C2|nr:hypothetical protein [Methylobacterium sp. C25]MCE4226346.1 hypothetical protein [Methylobacterium sp. C25]